jgi:heme/copper-type cytochrome/quinol oxidase subunit 4
MLFTGFLLSSIITALPIAIADRRIKMNVVMLIILSLCLQTARHLFV